MPQYTSAQLAQSLRNAGWSEDKIETAVAVAWAESGGRTDAVCNSCLGVREYSVGPWQINLYAHPWVSEDCAMDPDCAAKAAKQIHDDAGGFRPWAAYTSGNYQEYLQTARQGASEGSGSSSGEFGGDELEDRIREECGEQPSWTDPMGRAEWEGCKTRVRITEGGRDAVGDATGAVTDQLGLDIDFEKLGITALIITIGGILFIIGAMRLAVNSKAGQAVISGATGAAKTAVTKGAA